MTETDETSKTSHTRRKKPPSSEGEFAAAPHDLGLWGLDDVIVESNIASLAASEINQAIVSLFCYKPDTDKASLASAALELSGSLTFAYVHEYPFKYIPTILHIDHIQGANLRALILVLTYQLM